MDHLADFEAKLARWLAQYDATPLAAGAVLLASGLALLLVLSAWERALERMEKEA